MLSQHDETELLALIEGEADPQMEQELRRRLASDPPVAALVEAMALDRALLQAEAEPEFPADLEARLEHAMTRPMLMAAWGEDEPEPQPVPESPGGFRRRHNRAMRRRRLARMAIAAGFAVLLLTGLWAGLSAGLGMLQESRNLVASGSADHQASAEAARGSAATAAQESDWFAPNASIHHYAPQPVLDGHLAEALEAERELPAPQEFSKPVPVAFALVIESDDIAVTEATLGMLMASLVDDAALVQNFRYEEAVQLERRWMAQARSRGEQSPVPHAGIHDADAPTERLRELADRAWQQLRQDERDDKPDRALSRQLTGPAGLAAPLSQQLDYSTRGATHTITMRLTHLQALVEPLSQHSTTRRLALQPLPESNVAQGSGHPTPLWQGTHWLSRYAAVRSALAELEQGGGDPFIHLPVMVLEGSRPHANQARKKRPRSN